MLEVRDARNPDGLLVGPVPPGGTAFGLREDGQYLLRAPLAPAADRLLVDDVCIGMGSVPHPFQPAFYAGRVRVELRGPQEQRWSAWLDVGPASTKSGGEAFDAMVEEVRAFDETLLAGTAAATLAFGHTGRPGKYRNDVALVRLRAHGPAFLAVVEAIARSPHRVVTSEVELLPLSRVRRLHPTAVRDRRLSVLLAKDTIRDAEVESILLRSPTQTPTVDTPANRVIVDLLLRMAARVSHLECVVGALGLGAPAEEQAPRVAQRLEDLASLGSRLRQLLQVPPLRDVSRSPCSAAGLTQVAASPVYARAHRLGSRALAVGIEGDHRDDDLYVAPSWGIYETWCYAAVLGVLGRLCGNPGRILPPLTVNAERAQRFDLPGGGWVEATFQATFPALKHDRDRLGYSISRERRPDVLLVAHRGDGVRALVLDAKWRSGRANVLDAMASAHIYHDSLRIAGRGPERCLLLLPGADDVPVLSGDAFLEQHGVGAICGLRAGAVGVRRLEDLVGGWLA